MKTNKRPWPLSTLSNAKGIRQRIDTNPDFQRSAVWSTAQKQLLIDSMLREYDVPKMYWRKVSEKPDRNDVVDGQQRLRAIWMSRSAKAETRKSAKAAGQGTSGVGR